MANAEIIRLCPVTGQNLNAVCALDAGDDGRQVAPNVRSMAQAAVHPHAWPRAICAGERLVGFLMLYDPTLAAEPEEREFFLWRLMIDRRQQRNGFGQAAVSQLIDHVRSRPGASQLLVSYAEHAASLGRFYGSLGFVATGEVDDGEIVMARKLDP